MRIKFATFVSDGQDGSVYTHVIGTQGEANKMCEDDETARRQVFDGAVSVHEIEVDENGKVTKVY